MEDEELKREGEALKAEQAGEEDQTSEIGETEGTEVSNDIPGTQEGTSDEIEETEETEENTEQAPAGEKEEKKGFLKKKRDPRGKKIEELTDRVERQMAEFENFRKRTDREESVMYGIGTKDTIERTLPVIDNFEGGLATVPENAKETPLAEDIEKVYKQFRRTLEEANVRAIEAINQEFNPNYHNAVVYMDDDSLGENMVAEELQKDYVHEGSVVRHSMVRVAN